ncbi:hypothetical protein NDU88_006729 [Pleurodeles waltl]|uniref:Uncharacterized protein n=1 Tax=Pleurodeles waltl TaxID=8319 RepID=A0AAV7PMQ3_PLEWA|nr:hypothetical protein NDU88_006729 [Pleurodeles waltl]
MTIGGRGADQPDAVRCVGRTGAWADKAQEPSGEGLPGCDNPRVLGGHEDHAVHQQLGRPAGGKSLLVRVGTPVGHRVEGRVKPRAVHLTSQEASGHGVLGQETCPGFSVWPSTSRGAGLNLEHIEEEQLDYDEEVEAHEVAVPTGGMVETSRVIKKAVQCDRPVGRNQELVVGNFPSGEDYGLDPIGLGGGRVGLVDAKKNSDRVLCGVVGVDHGKGSVDASIQVGIDSKFVSGKSDVSLGIGSEVPGKSDVAKAGDGKAASGAAVGDGSGSSTKSNRYII